MVMQDKVQNVDELAKRYRIEELGYIATGYIKEQEEAVYMAASRIISSKYPNLISEDELYKKIKNKGNIFTIYRYSGDRRNGVYDSKTGNVLVPYFVKRMSENLLHELSHKAGFIDADETFFSMNHNIRETGTEIVASSSFSSKYAKDAVLLYVWGKYPEKASSELLVYSLLNQLNILVGEQNLENSILHGHDYFKEIIIKKYGSDFYNYVCSQLDLITIKKNNLYSTFEVLGIENEKLLPQSMDLFEDVKEFEDKILKKEFDIRLKNIDSLESGKKFLEQLNKFGENRLQEENVEGILEDPNLENIFYEYKSIIEKKYGETGINFKKADIQSLSILEIEDDLEPGELEKIAQMAMEFEIASRERLKRARKGKFTKFIRKIFSISTPEINHPKLPATTNDFNNDLIVENFVPKYNDINSTRQEKAEREKVD